MRPAAGELKRRGLTRDPTEAATPAGPTAALTPRERAIVAEEEALLARVRASLAARRGARAEGDLVGRLRELRDEALESTSKDLPTVFQEMGVVRAVMERVRPGELPDPAAPYFAHLRVREAGEERDYLLGRHTFVDREAGVRVVDWRWAPIASLFYRYREGEEFEEPFPGRMARGVVAVRRVVVVDRAGLARIAADGVALSRGPGGAWRAARGAAAALGGGEGTAARAGALGTGAGERDRAAGPDVTALLDADQYAAVAAPAETPLLVLGSAGSGKTTVALHRLARIAFEDPRRFPASRLQVVVPETGLARLAARLLEPLGLDRAQVRTVDAWARGAFQSAFGVPPPRLVEETPPLVARLKRHPALLRGAPAPAAPRRGAAPRSVRCGASSATSSSTAPFLEGVVARRGGRAAHHRHRGDAPAHAPAARAAARRTSPRIDPDRREALDGTADRRGHAPGAVRARSTSRTCPSCSSSRRARAAPRAGRSRTSSWTRRRTCRCSSCSCSGGSSRGAASRVAGDESQQTFSSYAGLARGARRARRGAGRRRCGSRRPTAARARSPRRRTPSSARSRPPRRRAPARRARRSRASTSPPRRTRTCSSPARSATSSSASRARRWRWSRTRPRWRARSTGSSRTCPRRASRSTARFTFRPGVDVTDVASVKGLEFDYVVVPDASARAYPDDEDARRRLHVAVTRAAHQLWIAAPGHPSPLIAGIGPV